jgi:hypothetical protein
MSLKRFDGQLLTNPFGENRGKLMAAIRGNAGAKWARRAGNAGPEYEEGIRTPRTSWAAATQAAAASQAAGVQAAIQGKRFEKGVAKAGDARWASKSLSKGVSRFGAGVADAQADYESGFAPYAQTIASTVLPPRGPKGDPKNFDRVRVMANAMRATKMGR